MIGAILVAVGPVMRMVTKRQPAHMTRLGLDVIAAGIAFGLVVLVVFAITRIGGAGRPGRGRAGPVTGAEPPATSPRRPPGQADHRGMARTGLGSAPPAGRRSRPTRRRGAFRAAARAEPDERLLTRRAYRRARGGPAPRNAGRRGHPGDPAHRRGPDAGAGGPVPGGPVPGGLTPGGTRSQDRPSSGRAGPQPPRPGYPPGMNPGGPGRAPSRPGRPASTSRATARDHGRPREAPRPGYPTPGRDGMQSRDGMPAARSGSGAEPA